MTDMKKTFWGSKHRSMADYYWFEEYFSKKEIKEIIKIAKGYEKVGAVTGSELEDKKEEEQNLKVRSSTIRWLPYNEETSWIYEKLHTCITEANEAMWGFNWSGWSEDIQYTEYFASKKGHYDWHQDVGEATMANRKISITLLLSDEHEGGELEIWNTGAVNLPKKAGTVVVFPSYMLHRVAPVTKGTRRSVVMWVGGDHYR